MKNLIVQLQLSFHKQKSDDKGGAQQPKNLVDLSTFAKLAENQTSNFLLCFVQVLSKNEVVILGTGIF